MSAVDDLLNTLLESEDTNLLGVYIGSVMPSNSEWEKMRQSLPMQVCLRLDSAYLILKFELCASLNIFILFWERKKVNKMTIFCFFLGRKNVNEMSLLLCLYVSECSYIGCLLFIKQWQLPWYKVN